LYEVHPRPMEIVRRWGTLRRLCRHRAKMLGASLKTWRTLVCVVALAISACTNQPHLVVKPADSAFVPQPLPTGPLGSFLGAHLLTTTEGWVLTDNYLLWTANGGRTWNNITPSLQRSARKIQTVFFLDPKLGWIVTSSGVLHTTDGGATWRTSPLPALLPTGRPAGPICPRHSRWRSITHRNPRWSEFRRCNTESGTDAIRKRPLAFLAGARDCLA